MSQSEGGKGIVGIKGPLRRLHAKEKRMAGRWEELQGEAICTQVWQLHGSAQGALRSWQCIRCETASLLSFSPFCTNWGVWGLQELTHKLYVVYVASSGTEITPHGWQKPHLWERTSEEWGWGRTAYLVSHTWVTKILPAMVRKHLVQRTHWNSCITWELYETRREIEFYIYLTV